MKNNVINEGLLRKNFVKDAVKLNKNNIETTPWTHN